MIERILPPAVSAADSFGDPPGITVLPEEQPIIAKAIGRRRQEFTTGRHCARTALRLLGADEVPVLSGEKGMPLWPAGIVGSITHCAGYRAAVVARECDIVTVGIDAEPCEPLPVGVLRLVSLERERERVAELARTPGPIHWDRLLFCAKEAVYKAWFPLARRWLDFSEADITISPDDGTFEARLLVPGPTVGGREVTGFTGRWMASDGLLVAAVAMPA